MNQNEARTVARLVRIALGYESREVRIGQMLTSPYLDVRLLANRLKTEGYLGEATVNDVITLPDYSPPRGRQS